MAVVLLLLVPTSAFAARAHIFESAFGPDGTESTNFERLGPVAVDQESHDVYVADLEAQKLSKFDESGTPTNFSGLGSSEITGLAFGGGRGENQIAVDPVSHRIYATQSGTDSIRGFQASGEPVEFTAGPGAGTSEITGLEEACGVAVDSNGDIYAADFFTGVHVYAPSGEELAQFSSPESCNVAVDSTGAVYVNLFQGLVNKFTPSSFPVTNATTYSSAGTVEGDPTFAIAVDPSTDELYVDKQTSIAQYESSGELIGTFGNSGAGALTASEGLGIDGATGNVYVSDAEGQRRVEIFGPPPLIPPTIDSTSFANVSSTSADLRSQINPNFFDTHYSFQYVTQAQFEATGFEGASETVEGDLGAIGANAVNASECPALEGEGKTCVLDPIATAHIGNLAPETTYRFRVLAENEANEGSPEVSAEPPAFSTFPASPPGLADGRAYEMVSPAVKQGEVFTPEPLGGFAGSCTECLAGFDVQKMPMQASEDGSSVVFEGQPFTGGLASGPNEYLATRDATGWNYQGLSGPEFGGVTPQGYKAFSSDVSTGVLLQIEPALAPEAPPGFANLYIRHADGTLTPVITEAPKHRTPGTRGEERFAVTYGGANSGADATPAFSHVIFEANDALTVATSAAPKAPEVGAEENDLYEWVGGELKLVNVLPGNASAAANAVIGSGTLLMPHSREDPDFSNAISADGSRIFWSDKASGQAYVRIDGEKTEEIPDAAGRFLTATTDGSKVLLSDGHIYGNLEAEPPTEEADLTAGEGGFLGILGASDDLSRVYFVDTAALTPPGELGVNGEHAEAGKENLYAWVSGSTKYIGTLVPTDNEMGIESLFGAWHASPSDRSAQVTPDGRYLTFMSSARLTGFDNTPRNAETRCRSGAEQVPCTEVFEYDSVKNALVCPSCNPTQDRPLGKSSLSLFTAGRTPLPQPSNLAESGHGLLFFESQDVLSPFDSNGRIQDVYEWKPDEVGGCERAAGCISLVSSGHSANDSQFVDSTPSGDDVFFITRQQLLPRDKDGLLDLYDARAPHEAGEPVGFSEGETPPCEGESCKAPQTSPPSFPAPGSASVNESPPPKPKPKKKPACKRGFVRKHGKCVKKPHSHKKHKKQHKRAAKKRQGGNR